LCASFCRSNAYGATQQFHQREVFDVKRKLEDGRWSKSFWKSALAIEAASFFVA